MKYVAKAESVETSVKVSFKEPMLELSREGTRLPLVTKFLKTFSLRLNDLVFNAKSLSDNYLHFSRIYGLTWFDVSFGLEEWSAKIIRAQSLEQVKDLFIKLSQVVESIPTASQQIIVNSHLHLGERLKDFLESLNPYVPPNFETILENRGVFYTLRIAEHELSVHLTVVPSLHFANSVYLSVESVFEPCLYKFEEAIEVFEKYSDSLLQGLNLDVLKV